jgi:hypothetical protein
LRYKRRSSGSARKSNLRDVIRTASKYDDGESDCK